MASMKRNHILPLAFAILFAISAPAQRVTPGAQSFAPLEQWRSAVAAGDWQGLENLYTPNALIVSAQGKSNDPSGEINFWRQQSPIGLTLEVASSDSSQGPGTLRIIFDGEFRHKAALGPSASALLTFYVTCVQIWQKQGDNWRISSALRREPTRLKQPLKLNPNLYAANANAREEIQQALARAKKQSKRVILDFGANWCYDCHVLDLAFHHPEIEPHLEKSYILVHVDVGKYDKNLDLAELYSVPLKKGVPALAILNADGKLLFSQQQGEFEAARSMSPDDIAAFLDKWKPGP